MINGKKVTLKPAKLEQRMLVFEMGLSTDYMRTRFEEDFPTGYAAFAEDYEDAFFDGRAPSVCGGMVIYRQDEAIGFISYCSISYGKAYLMPGVMEIDIWMDGEENCGRGLGNDAIITLTDHLNEAQGIHTCIIVPERNNPRAVRAYEKAGFAEVGGDKRQGLLETLYEPEYLSNFIDELDYLNRDHTFNERYVFMRKVYPSPHL